ncbi:MAG TPA: 5-oxoprolinase subunit PxpB [Thermodesulfobacteriota bacterium]
MPGAYPRIRAAGDRAIVVEFGETIDPAISAMVTRLDARLAALRPAGLVETVPTYRSLMVHHDPVAGDPEALAATLERLAVEAAREPRASPNGARVGRLVEVPVVYGGDEGPDMAYVCERTGLSPEEVVRRHTAPTYVVYMLGFLPGYPYLGGLDPSLAVPRLATPRLRIPGGSVGIGGQQTGIYTLESPGGWAIIGRTSLTLFDPLREEPCLILAGDRVRFVAVARQER